MESYVRRLVADFESLVIESSDEAIARLVEALEVRDSGTYEKRVIPDLACRALLLKGVAGVEALSRTLPNAPGLGYPVAILRSLWNASEGRLVDPVFCDVPATSPLSGELTEATRFAAREKFVAFVDDCRTDPESFHRLINVLFQEQMRSVFNQESNQRFQQAVFRVLTDSTFRLSDRHIDQFRRLLVSNEREESYQSFFTLNPVFLDPLASRLISKQKLGSDFITDYVLERVTGDYLIVEIEKPSDLIFTQANNFSAEFTHAFGQVLDFAEWVEQNIAYAQNKLPGIVSPKGLLVIGMRQQLTPQQTNKLKRFCKNSASITVLTFDDLLVNVESLQRNIRHRVGFSL